MNLKTAIKKQSVNKTPKAKKEKQPNGFILYEGASRLNPAEQIAAIITLNSANPKTGNMSQLWILHKDLKPTQASKQKKDSAVCGGCKLRQSLNGACYVTLHHAPTAIFKAYKKGNYKKLSVADYQQHFENKYIRFGAYGDPAAIPLEILIHLKTWAKNNTSYTHQWKQAEHQPLKFNSMASVDNIKEAKEATAKGWRYFRVATEKSEILKNEIICPNLTHGTTCKNCTLCNGAKENDNRKNIVILAHGVKKNKFND